jgi:response regulator of citrate/malate metabolism
MRINIAIVEDDADIQQSLQEIISSFEELDCVAACAGATGYLIKNFHHDPL